MSVFFLSRLKPQCLF